MGLLDLLLAPARAVLSSAEQEVADVLPVQSLTEIEKHLLGTAQSISAHVAVIEKLTESLNDALPALTATLGKSLPELVAAVEGLGDKLAVVAAALEPVVEAEEKVAGFKDRLLHPIHGGDHASDRDRASDRDQASERAGRDDAEESHRR